MIYLILDDYFSLLTAIFTAYEKRHSNIEVYSSFNQLSFINEVIEISPQNDKASRVDKKLKSIMRLKSYKEIKIALKSGLDNKLTVIFNYLLDTINANADISDNFTNKNVYAFNEIVKKVKLEIHHLKGFIRFSKTKEGIYYARFKPDNNVCENIFFHFIKRYFSMPFILHDEKYNVICAYNGKNVKIVNKKTPPLKIKDDVSKLFKIYCDTVNIKERKNLKLMKNYLPKRYQVNMPEKDELLF
ncbi:MAG: TIGR03915 family putative DNA repair protein [Clostridia bacterium]|nr:TIGR03915 family putative DNA repair protein [Clostridia bacterium]